MYNTECRKCILKRENSEGWNERKRDLKLFNKAKLIYRNLFPVALLARQVTNIFT